MCANAYRYAGPFKTQNCIGPTGSQADVDKIANENKCMDRFTEQGQVLLCQKEIGHAGPHESGDWMWHTEGGEMDTDALAKSIVREIRVDTESLGHDWDASEWEVAEQSTKRVLVAAQPDLASLQLRVKELADKWPHEYCVTCGRDLSKKSGLGCCSQMANCRRCELEAALRGDKVEKGAGG